MSKGKWIWYPEDYEHWLHAKVSVKRQFRGYASPPFWRLENAYTNVKFRKVYESATPLTLTLSVQGDYVVVLDGKDTPIRHERSPVTSIELPAGKHELTVKIVNDKTVPSVYAECEVFATDDTWETTRYDGRWVNAASGVFADVDTPPGEFPFAYETRRPVSVTQRDDSALLDFGEETFGFVKLANALGNGLVRLYYGESLPEALAGEGAETFDELTVDCATPTTVRTPVTRAFRYILLKADEGVFWSEVLHDYEYLPLTRQGAFRSSDDRLNRIWEVSAHTLHITTREFMYDGLKRDRWVWSGDAYQSFLMNNYLFSDQEATKRTLIALRGKDPIETHINTIMDYSFYWIIAFRDYWLQTGDLAFIRERYPKMLSLMDYCLGRRNAEGMMEGYPEDWVFVDWAPMEKRGEVSTEQLLLCRSLETMAGLARELGDEANASRFAETASRLKERIFELFWDEGKGAFISGRLDGETIDQVLKYPNMFALRFGYLNEDQAEQVKRNALLNDEVQKITTPYMRFYELEALSEIGETEVVLREMRDYWGAMLDLGATTFWEEFDPAVPDELQYDMYGDKFRKSLCHAWGASPIYLLGKYSLGVRPTAPAYSEYAVEPRLGDLQWIDGAVPTPNGAIAVYADRESVRVTTCASGAGTLRIRSHTAPEANEGLFRAVGPDAYELELALPSFRYEIKAKLIG